MKGEAKRRAMEEKWKARRAAAGEGEGGGDHEEQRKPKSAMPQKRFYRARAHSNPLSDSYFPVPTHPGEVNWHEHFPAFFLPPPPLVQEPGNQDVPATEAEEVAGDAAAAAQKGDSGAGGSGAQEAPAGPVPAVQVATGEGRPNGGAEEHNGGEQAAAPPGAGTSGDPVAGGGLSTGGAGTGDVPLVRFADVGCGFGGLLVKLSPVFPDTLMVGMELRDKVSEYVKDRIKALRLQHPRQYENITVLRTNAMKYLPNYFVKGQLTKMFFLFPDPHFKEKNHRRRIITQGLLAEYAYLMAVGGILYTITDVEELGAWMDSNLAAHPLFEKVPDAELEADPVVPMLVTSSEEGLKVERNGGSTYRAIYRRIAGGKASAEAGS